MKKSVKILAVLLTVLTLGVFVSTLAVMPAPNTAYAAVYQQGSRGSTVKTIQQKLKNWGYYKGAVDGIFGAKTKEAVKYFQRKNGLTADGIVGKKTLSALGMSSGTNSGNNSGATSSYSDADVALLTKLIYGEARGESYVGQVAVGAVVMNRVKSASFPNSISGVIYQSYAFTAVDDGQINLTPNATARKAALDAMNGWDPTYGAIYYYNPRTATSQWIFSRQTTITIGNHVFAK